MNSAPRFDFRRPFLVLLGLMLLLPHGAAFAAVSREVILSPPVGGDVLPGGGLSDATITTGFLFRKLIPFVIRYGIGIAALLAVIAIMVGGYQMMTAFGNEEQKDQAKRTLLFSILGLILAITAYGIVTVVTSIRLS